MNNEFIYVNEAVPYYKSRLFSEYNIKHAFFTRKGGISGGVFESLNFAEGAGDITDSVENVLGNYSIAAGVFGLEANDICRSYQTHTTVVELADEKDRGRGVTKPKYEQGVDGMVTKTENLLLSVRTADCVPVLLCNKQGTICAAVHSGWRGTVGGITKNAVELMVSLGANRNDILAAIGPCIGSCCYEVGAELFDEFISVSSDYAEFFKPVGEKYMLDLNFANQYILQEAGIKSENIAISHLCTKCREDKFFSHRRQGVNRGTLGAFICV